MKIGFIGCGNMAQAIIGGLLKQGVAGTQDILATTSKEESAKKASETLGISVITDNQKVAAEADILVVAVKPIFYEAVLAEIKEQIHKEQIVISIAPGKSLAWLGEQIGADRKIVRTMPNTPALVGEGMTGVCVNENVTHTDMAKVMQVLEACGKAEIVPERLMDVVVSVSGSSPAYVFMFIEAMADAAVADGMPRAQAYEFAAQAVLGSAKMVLETGRHPGELKDMVCSPGGTTIEAVRVLEAKGMRSAVIEAMKACAEKCK